MFQMTETEMDHVKALIEKHAEVMTVDVKPIVHVTTTLKPGLLDEEATRREIYTLELKVMEAYPDALINFRVRLLD